MKMSLYIAYLRSLYLFYQTAHWIVKGQNGYSLHLLFKDLYKQVANHADSAAEKSITVFYPEIVDLSEQLKYFNKILEPTFKKENFIEIALAMEAKFRQLNKDIRKDMKESEKFDDGIENMIISHYEESIQRKYLLERNL